MPLRQAHTKSRLGCQQCKARHVRCDQNHPRCGLCTRRGILCSLSGSFTATVNTRLKAKTVEPKHHTSPKQESSPEQLGAQITAVSAAELDSSSSFHEYDDRHPALSHAHLLPLQELELLHHFTTTTALTLCNTKAIQDVWRCGVPFLGLKYEFVMYGILALSALHIYSHKGGLRPLHEYSNDALRYSNLASAQFRNALQEHDDNKVPALFAASGLLCIFTRALQIYMPSAEHANLLDDISTFNTLGRGATSMAQNCHAKKVFEVIKPLVTPAPWDDIAVPPRTETALKKLKAYAESLTGHGPRREAYFDAIEALKTTFKAILANPERISLPFYWLTVIRRDIIDLIEQRDPVALVIVAHYARLLEKYNDAWWMGSMGETLLVEVCKVLGPDCAAMRAWPPETFGP